MEVDLAWIEEDARKLETKAEPPPAASKKKPPRLPGAAQTIPPMPHVPSIAPPGGAAPPKRMTIEVELDWIEVAKATEPVKAASIPPKKRSIAPAPARGPAPTPLQSRAPAQPRAAQTVERPRVKPIPREEPE